MIKFVRKIKQINRSAEELPQWEKDVENLRKDGEKRGRTQEDSGDEAKKKGA
jgi:hypothetical protein